MDLVVITFYNDEKKQYLAERYEVFDNGSFLYLKLADTRIWINLSEVKEFTIEIAEEKK